MEIVRGVLVAALQCAALLVAGCAKSSEPTQVLEKGVHLHAQDVGDRFQVLLVNNSDEAVTVNRLLRFNGFDPELTLVIDGEPAQFARVLGIGHVGPQDVSNPAFVLDHGKIIGMSLRDIDMESLYGIKKGQCAHVQVLYQNQLALTDIQPLQLKSNTIEYCH